MSHNSFLHDTLIHSFCVSTWLKNLLDLSLAGIMWWSLGWGIAFGAETEDGEFNQFAPSGSFFARGEEFNNLDGSLSTTAEGYNWALWLFQVQWRCNCAAGLVVGTRTRLGECTRS